MCHKTIPKIYSTIKHLLGDGREVRHLVGLKDSEGPTRVPHPHFDIGFRPHYDGLATVF